MLAFLVRAVVGSLLIASSAVLAEQPWTFSNNTRYLSLGDSLAAGYGATPTTQGYAYLLYQGGTFDQTTNTIFANAAVPGATSADVLVYQVPQVARFGPHVITISVGGNDLLAILEDPTQDPTPILGQFAANLVSILSTLLASEPAPRIYISNLYDIPEITGNIFGARQIIMAFNGIVADIARPFRVGVADVFGAFEGRTGLLLVERNGAGQFEVHPTNAGYRAMAKAFEAAAAQ
jgi:lysophospholipase L1-like esterase